MDREAIEEAIEVLEDANAEMLTETGNENYYGEAIAVLRQALETKREWVGLTAYEIQEIHLGNQHWGSFACAIEQALKEKNHG